MLLLPGMDGTGDLFRPLLACLPHAEVLRYPNEPWGYDALEVYVRDRCRHRVVLAESFSSPIGLRLANDPPARLEAVVLVAGFRRAPRLVRLGALLGRLPFSVVPPATAVNALMVGHNASAALVNEVRAVLRTVPASVMAARLQAIRTLNEPCQPRVPTLVVSASKDQLVAPTSWPGCRIVEVPGPHLLAQRHPDRVAAQVLSFVDGLA